jgi:glycosyltransferase involved in cell wall biosynthesis
MVRGLYAGLDGGSVGPKVLRLAVQTSPDLVSIVIPCRNEADFIERCLLSLVNSDYPKDAMEVLVVDGRSDDGTRAVVERFRARHAWIRLLDNPSRLTPVALNIGIRAARGTIVFRMDAHSEWTPTYIAECVRSLERTGADCVGGIMVTAPRSQGAWGRAVVAALSHPFGVGNSYFRIAPDQPRWVDTVFGGAYRRDVFREVGLFNERLVRGQDIEFNLRLKREGKRTLLVPTIRSYYYARTDLWAFVRHNWTNGVWAILPFLYSRVIPVTWRHLVPMVFVEPRRRRPGGLAQARSPIPGSDASRLRRPPRGLWRGKPCGPAPTPRSLAPVWPPGGPRGTAVAWRARPPPTHTSPRCRATRWRPSRST